jgi:hypothetical protein
MSRLKTHFAVPATGGGNVPACGRGFNSRRSEQPSYVDCRACQNTDEFAQALAAYKAKLEADFAAQTPRKVIDMWQTAQPYGTVFYVCRVCGGDLWRERPRSLFSFHFVCESCGNSIHPMTETGMST